MPELRDYQKDLLIRLKEHIGKGNRTPLIQLETGGGKTIIAGWLSKSIANQYASQKGCSCLYLVHRKELVEQVRNTLDDYGLGSHVGVIQAGQPVTPWGALQVASVQTLVRRLDRYDWLTPRVIFIDEAHHIRASTWEKIIERYSTAYRIGLTATPARLDGKGLGKHFSAIIEGPSTRHLIDTGNLCEMDCYSIPAHINLDGLKKVAGDYSKKDLQSRSTSRFRADIVDSYVKHCMGRSAIHYAASIDDSIRVCEKLRGLGLRAEHVDGETPHRKRKQILEAFGKGDIDCLSNYEIVTEGFDVPKCDAIVISRKTSSLVLFRQMVGRGRRPKEDGRKAVLLDLVGNLDMHGHPDIQPEWSLEDGVKRDAGTKSEKKSKICDSCGHVLVTMETDNGYECIVCGNTTPKKTVEDLKIELVEAKAAEKARKSEAYRSMNSEVYHSGGDLDKLRDIARRYGKNPFIVNRWKEIKIYKMAWEKQNRKMEEIQW